MLKQDGLVGLVVRCLPQEQQTPWPLLKQDGLVHVVVRFLPQEQQTSSSSLSICHHSVNIMQIFDKWKRVTPCHTPQAELTVAGSQPFTPPCQSQTEREIISTRGYEWLVWRKGGERSKGLCHHCWTTEQPVTCIWRADQHNVICCLTGTQAADQPCYLTHQVTEHWHQAHQS